MEQLTGLDATFLYLETSSLHMHVSMAAMFDPSTVPGGYSFDKLRDLVSSRLELAPIFRRRLVEVPFRLGHPYWVDDPTFDIEYHIRRGAVPAPGGVEELAQFVGDVCSRQLDRTKPLWEMYIVEGLRGGQIAVVTKIHHCTIDGVSGAELLSQLFDLEPEPPARPAPDAPLAVDEHLPSDLQLLAQSLGTRLTRPFGMTKLAWRTGRALLDVRRVRARGAGTRRVASHHAAHFAQRVHHPAPAGGVFLDLPRGRQAHQAGVRHHAQRRGPGRSAPARCGGTSSTATSCPTSRSWPRSRCRPPRPTPTGAAPTRSPPCSWPCPVTSPTRSRGFRSIRESTKGAKEEHNALGADVLLNWTEHATPNVFSAAARAYTRLKLADHHRPIHSLVISNVPGPRLPALPGRSGDGGRLPSGPGHGRSRIEHHRHELPGCPQLGSHGLRRDRAPPRRSCAATSPTPLDELAAAAKLGARPPGGCGTGSAPVPPDRGVGTSAPRSPRAEVRSVSATEAHG